MSGIIEEINSKLDRIIAFLSQQQTAPAQQPQQATNMGLNGSGAGTPHVDPFGVPSQQQQVQVTDDMIMQLIQPHLANEAVKAQLTAQLQAMGIPNLPAAQPGQYADIYARFKAVLANVTPMQSGGPTGII